MVQDGQILSAVKGKVACDTNTAASLLQWIVERRVKDYSLTDIADQVETFAEDHDISADDLALITEQAESIAVTNGAHAAPKIISAVDLYAKEIEPPKWIIPGVLPAGLTILAGKPKSGKSWLALDLAIATASGGALFDALDCEQPCDTLFLGLEDTEHRLQDRMKRLLVGEKPPVRLNFCTEWARADKGGLDDLYGWVQAHDDAGLIVVDTLQHIRATSKKNGTLYGEDVMALKPLKKLADEHKLGVVVIHHTRKAKAKDPFETVSGSYGITATADTNIVLDCDPATSNATLHIQGRDIGEIDLVLLFDQDLGRWHLLGGCELPATQAQQDMLKAITSKALSPKDIAAKMGSDVKHVSNILPKLVKKGLVVQAGYGKYISATYKLEQQL